jgi:hypothetical protein
MLVTSNIEIEQPVGSLDDVTIGALLTALHQHASKPLVFVYGGRPVRPGYHVTEVKAGQFAALDCGANHEEWSEIFVQLLDVDEGGPMHMPAGKFAAIIRKVTEHLALDPTARLTFEVSDGIRPMALYRAAFPIVRGDVVSVSLSSRPASCKPRDRWLEETNSAKAEACCGSGAACCSTG